MNSFLAVEEAFDLDISDEAAEAIVTMGDFHACIVGLMNARPNSDRDARVDEGAVWERLKSITIENLGIEPDQVVPEARIVDDLGIN